MSLPVWKADFLQTAGLAALLLRFGAALTARAGWLSRTNIPAPAVAGLLFAMLALALHRNVSLGIDTTLRGPLQSAFFATIGFQATLGLLRAGGAKLVAFYGVAIGTAIVQNAVGMGAAALLGVPVLVGVICGSLTLTGGPATGIAFAETFEKAGIKAAQEIAVASATFGILFANLVGNPVATWLIRRHRLATPVPAAVSLGGAPAPLSAMSIAANLTLLLAVVGAGTVLDAGFRGVNIVLPAVIAPMIVAAIVRFIEDRRAMFGFDPAAMHLLGSLALAFFLVIALCDLKLWALASLAVPMLVILTLQVLVTTLYAVCAVFYLFGRNYEAAAFTTGHIGFSLGITPNAVANLDSLTARYGPAPRAYLIVPIIGGFFIDFPNAVFVTLLVKWFG